MGAFDTIKSLSFDGKPCKRIVFGNTKLWEKPEYQQVEWIGAASNNGAYIDLGIVFDTKAETEIGYIFQGAGKDLQIFGACENGGRLRYCLSAEYGGINETSRFTLSFYDTSTDGNFRNIFYHLGYPSVGDELRMKFTVDPSSKTKALNLDTGVLQERSAPATYTMTRNLYLLGQNYNTGYRGNGLKQVTYFKHWNKDGEIVRDMIPCYRKSDGEIGMYDLVSKIFFTNAGSGAFTKGADVNV